MAPSKNKKKKETQKATDKPQKPWEEAKMIAPGCNCPLGCLIGEAVAEGDDDIVELECSTSACTKDSRVHAVCYEHWEGELVKAIEKTNRRGGWRASWVQQHLWTPTCMRHLTSDFTKCQCGGQLVKLEPSISLNREVAAEKPAKKAKHHVPGGVKKLPGLRPSDTKIAGAGVHHQPLISNGLDDDVHQLPVAFVRFSEIRINAT
uniref:Headcase N-terminal domain-containing protein n=1 Tax=Plectus sambesii TaxID=2011161 RepID=A0A914X6U6_9BILA